KNQRVEVAWTQGRPPMKFIALQNGKQVPFEVNRIDGHYVVNLAGKTTRVDAVKIAPHALSLLVEGKSFEAGFEKKEEHYSVTFYNDTIEFDLFEARKYRAAEVARKSVATGPSKIV